MLCIRAIVEGNSGGSYDQLSNAYRNRSRMGQMPVHAAVAVLAQYTYYTCYVAADKPSYCSKSIINWNGGRLVFTWCNPCEGTPGGKQPAGHDGAPKPRQPPGPVPLPVLPPPTPPTPPLYHLQTANELFLPFPIIQLLYKKPPFWFVSTFSFYLYSIIYSLTLEYIFFSLSFL
jgi:hypothetical protein